MVGTEMLGGRLTPKAPLSISCVGYGHVACYGSPVTRKVKSPSVTWVSTESTRHLTR